MFFKKKKYPTRLFLSNQATSVEQQIKQEKQKRNQAYQAMNYILSRVTYFDFFSSNAFNIAVHSKYFTQLYEQKTVTSEYLLLPFFYCESNVSSFLAEYPLPNKLSQILNSKKIFTSSPWWNPFSLFSNPKKRAKSLKFNSKIEFSLEVNQLFEKAAENAMNRFKTPVISSEILFITLMEEKTKAGKLIQDWLGDETEWQMFRYRLLKRLHRQESTIRSEVSKNQQYFAYLLKTELKEAEFEKMIDMEILSKGTSLFRNVLISEIVKLDIFDLLWEEIRLNIKISRNNRKYSS